MPLDIMVNRKKYSNNTVSASWTSLEMTALFENSGIMKGNNFKKMCPLF